VDRIYKRYFSSRLYSKQRRTETLVFTKVIQGVCTESNAEACKKVKFTESGSFIGGIAGGAAAGLILGGSTAVTICAALGAPTAGLGALACGLVVVGLGSYAAGDGGGELGKAIGERIYEVAK
jgi:hypothetical protein